MGRLVAKAVPEAGAILVGGVSRNAGPDGSAAYRSLLLLAADCDVIVDFTTAQAVPAHADAVCAGRAAWVLGTTGLSPANFDAVRRAAAQVAVVHAANFSPGMALVLALAQRLASALPAEEYDAEILEMHHRDKQDAPSGTAIALGQAVADARGVVLETMAPPRQGPRRPGTIGMASLRGGTVVGDHTLLFAGDSEHISLSHRALDRAVFARGAVRAALWVGHGRGPGLYGMNDVLGLNDEKDSDR